MIENENDNKLAASFTAAVTPIRVWCHNHTWVKFCEYLDLPAVSFKGWRYDIGSPYMVEASNIVII